MNGETGIAEEMRQDGHDPEAEIIMEILRQINAELDEIAEKHHLSPKQTALAFVLSQPNMTAVTAKTAGSSPPAAVPPFPRTTRSTSTTSRSSSVT